MKRTEPADRKANGASRADVLRMLDLEGNFRGRSAPLNDGEVKRALRYMMLSNAIDEKCIKLQRLGRLGVYGPVQGQEASVVGSALALDRSKDWLVPAYREQPAMLMHGLSLEGLLAAYMGKIDYARVPDGVNMLPRNQSVGAQLPHAVGLAWGLALDGLDAVVLVYLGEGASSEGDFHESANLAGLVRAPIVFFLQNNGWAISTPADRQSATDSFAVRAAGYGFPGMLVDGNDLFAVFSATAAAVARARAGGGPTLIESRTYRVGFHNTTDNPREYRTDGEVAEARKTDPILRVQRYLRSRNTWNDAEESQMQASVRAEVDAAVEVASTFPRPPSSAIFEHVYETAPERLVSQREQHDQLFPD